ncbi:MAG: phosphomannomutase/phosphoglucomutase [Bacteroidales bacterium]|nr:phosphomannomutase/phosphoglucomutase [Bacteroidales bacterium]MCF8326845.1 phosphomannomutase/phosphoglucomutase [Bacteroidales bacterium]
MNAFKAYDIRGIYNKDFNKEDVYRIGYYLPVLMQTDKILIGKDSRISSPEIFQALADGINAQGCDVYDAGITTTPMVYYLTANDNFDASVMITASHNDKEYNGLKISGPKATPIGYDNGLAELEQMIAQEPQPNKTIGKIIDHNRKEIYKKFLDQYKKDYSGLKLAVDCSNGVAGLFAENIFGQNTQYLNLAMNGDFPGHAPNPLVEKNVESLKQTVRENHLDLGVIFDGDADRVMFVDEKAQFIRPDLIIALMGDYFLKDKANEKVLFDIRSSRVVKEHLEKLGAQTYMWRVGRAFAARKLKDINGLFSGELAGHYYFRDFFYSDSGMLSAMIVLNVMLELKQKGITISEYFSKINYLSNSGEINFKINQKKEAMEALKKYFSSQEELEALYDFDGYRLEFKNWWFNVRPSNTEPYLRFIAEANSTEKLKQVIDKTQSIINQIKDKETSR